MLADGFSIEEMVALSRIGLATAQAERVVAAARTFEVAGGGAKVLCGDKTMTRDHEPETGSGLESALPWQNRRLSARGGPLGLPA
jgi:hypothetical protein